MNDNTGNIANEGTAVSAKKDFQGYTLSELRYQRALAALKREYAREKTFKRISKIRRRPFFGGSGKGASMSTAGNWLSKAAIGFNYADYAILGFSLFSSVRKVWKFFRKKR